jgi:hypothetical protein
MHASMNTRTFIFVVLSVLVCCAVLRTWLRVVSICAGRGCVSDAMFRWFVGSASKHIAYKVSSSDAVLSKLLRFDAGLISSNQHV